MILICVRFLSRFSVVKLSYDCVLYFFCNVWSDGLQSNTAYTHFPWNDHTKSCARTKKCETHGKLSHTYFPSPNKSPSCLKTADDISKTLTSLIWLVSAKAVLTSMTSLLNTWPRAALEAKLFSWSASWVSRSRESRSFWRRPLEMVVVVIRSCLAFCNLDKENCWQVLDMW